MTTGYDRPVRIALRARLQNILFLHPIFKMYYFPYLNPKYRHLTLVWYTICHDFTAVVLFFALQEMLVDCLVAINSTESTSGHHPCCNNSKVEECLVLVKVLGGRIRPGRHKLMYVNSQHIHLYSGNQRRAMTQS